MKNLGIIQINLPEITLIDSFNADDATDITSLLSDEEKEKIILAIKGEKLVYVSCLGITDDNEDKLEAFDLVPAYIEKYINRVSFLVARAQTTIYLSIYFDKETQEFYILS